MFFQMFCACLNARMFGDDAQTHTRTDAYVVNFFGKEGRCLVCACFCVNACVCVVCVHICVCDCVCIYGCVCARTSYACMCISKRALRP